ncbi:mechanosensitive ion channel family protein [Kangiella koreensis]|uniref:Mechanosensing system component YbdG n=1 Tax=Kangiella koreensis (strain DSM 16069 / JCM 12317 / KCTC 12182 / SW-125) TaxID=523791 RepID=C7RAA5_KANKD|nr:mechanosensitive ion channel family protein [Kangiella koreensis]ACV26224.1 MscS Mechanosensitive ion channel [Kangiella koreensis DSM 16069]
MQQQFTEWLKKHGVEFSDVTGLISVLGLIVLISLVVHVILHRVVLRFIENRARKSEKLWKRSLFENKLFNRFALMIQGIIIYIQAGLWLTPDSVALNWVQTLSLLWIQLFALLTIFSFLDALYLMGQKKTETRALPLKGIFQSIKIVAVLVIGIFVISILVGKSPLLILSGLGAMTAVVMLVFKDPILGLVAGIQLSANNMLEVGDWLEMPQYGADGDVIEIALTTVKVRNWDKTITTVPTYALISNSFKNWRGMMEAGGRRIKRSVLIDSTSVEFMSDDVIQRLNHSKLLAPYLQQKLEEVNQYNQENGLDMSFRINGRRLTNLGTFRAYLLSYLKSHPQIHQELTLMVRQLEASANGIPLEVYAFTKTTDWAAYEGIQSDIFDHIFAVLPEFGLRVHQSPTGYDVRSLALPKQESSEKQRMSEPESGQNKSS